MLAPLGKERPSFITYYERLDRVHLFAVQPATLLVIGIFSLDVILQLTVWVLLGQKQYGSLLDFFRVSVTEWQFRTSLFDMVVVGLARAVVVSLLMWMWRTRKLYSLPVIAIMVTLAVRCVLSLFVCSVIFLIACAEHCVWTDQGLLYLVYAAVASSG